MFVRVIRARVVAKPLLRNAWDQLGHALAEQPGWRCMTAGTGRASDFIGTIEFSDPVTAHAAWSDRSVARWVGELERTLDSLDITDSEEAEIVLGGAREDARFVQIIEGSTEDKPRWRAINEAMQEVMRTNRPEVLAATVVWSEDRFLETVYFTSEQDAREGESQEFPGGMEGLFNELMDLVRDMSYLDLRSPWLRVHPAIDPAPDPTER